MNKAIPMLSLIKPNLVSHRSVRNLILVCLISFFTTSIKAQATLQVEILEGEVSTSCTGFFGLDPVVQWTVDIEGEGEEVYPLFANCFNSFPNIQYSKTADCYWQSPTELEICFRAFENEALFCNISEDCAVSICEQFSVPIIGGTFIDYTLELPVGGESEGFVKFRIALINSYIGNSNDEPCNALNMGLLNPNESLGSTNLSQYNNACANLGGTLAEPAPGTNAVTDNQGLWFQFQTGAEGIDLLEVETVSDPQNLGDPTNLQLVLYKLQDGNCAVLEFLREDLDPVDNDATIYLNCLEANAEYLILVDGTFDSAAGIEGYFDLEIRAIDLNQAANVICDAEQLGQIPEGDAVSLTLQTNNCADAIGDPQPTQFSLNQSVWYEFAAPASGNVIINATNHFPLVGNDLLDIQIAVFESSDNTCSGDLTEVTSIYTTNSINESLEIECLQEAQSYWVLIDGAEDIVAAAFDLSITDGGNFPPELDVDVTICHEDSYSVGINIYDTAGLYTDTLTAANGCDSIVHTTLSIATPLVGNLSEVESATFETTLDGSATANPSGGNPPYSYNWSNGSMTQTITDIAAGNYCVTISDELGCMVEDCVEVFFIGAVVIQVNDGQVACFGDDNGVLSFKATGGIPPYSYTWENTDDDNTGNGAINAENEVVVLSNLTAGSYEITVLGSGGLSTTIAASISQPNLISTTLNPILCFGESLTIGTTNYTASGVLNELLTATNGCDSLVTGTLTILPQNMVQNPITICADDTYEIGLSSYATTGLFEDILTDMNGCDSLVMTDLLVLEPIELTLDVMTFASGYELADAEANLTITGGTGNYSIAWEDGQNQTTANGLEGGTTICVTVTDDLACTSETCSLIPYIGDNIASLAESDATCFGTPSGSFTLTAAAGLAPFTYSWEAAGTGIGGVGTLADSENLTIPNLSQGNYQVTVQDANAVSTILTANINEPSPLEIHLLSVTMPTCVGDCDANFALEALGGTGDYTYTWSDNSLTALTGNNLCANDYFVTLTDENACSTTEIVSIEAPVAFQATVTELEAVSCFDGTNGQASIMANNTIQTILWDNGETTATATQLDAGIHNVSITDENGCMTETTIEITEPAAPVGLNLSEVASVSCHGDNDAVVLASSTGPGTDFNFHWNTLVVGEAAPTSFEASALSAGIYTVTVNNEAGCTAVESIEIGQPDPLVFEWSSEAANCLNDGNSGSVAIAMTAGGTGPYLYSLDGEMYGTEAAFVAVPAGAYTVAVQDVEGCISTDLATVLPPPDLAVHVPTDLEIILGETLEIDPTVTSQAVNYTWTSTDPGFDCTDCSSLVLQPTVNSVYSLVVTDSLSFCTDSVAFTIAVRVIRDVFIPNAFSPNDDGINDFFIPKVGLGVAQIQNMMVFDRAGNLVFQRDQLDVEDESLGWNGYYRNKILPNGVYVYSMTVVYVDGAVLPYVGDVSLLR